MILALLLSVISFEARMAMLDARLALKRHEVWASERRSWQRIIAMNEARFGEGVVPERDLIQARLEGGLLELGVSETKRELEAARRRLATLLSLPESELPNLEEVAEPTFPSLPPDAVGNGMKDLAQEYETAREQIQTLRLRLLGPCEESASIEELLYEQLKTTLLSVVEARRTCREIRLLYGDALHRAESSRLQLQKLLGREDFLS
jgi:outer membrane protein TolC